MVIIEKLVALFIFSDRLLKLAAKFERLTQIPMRGSKVRVQLYSFSKLGDCFGITSRNDVHVSQVCIDDHGKRVKLNRTPYLSYGTIDFAQRGKNSVTEGIVRECIVGV